MKLGFGNNWVVAGIVVTLPFGTRPVALPVLASLAVKGGDRSKPDLARDLVDALAERFPDRRSTWSPTPPTAPVPSPGSAMT